MQRRERERDAGPRSLSQRAPPSFDFLPPSLNPWAQAASGAPLLTGAVPAFLQDVWTLGVSQPSASPFSFSQEPLLTVVAAADLCERHELWYGGPSLGGAGLAHVGVGAEVGSEGMGSLLEAWREAGAIIHPILTSATQYVVVGAGATPEELGRVQAHATRYGDTVRPTSHVARGRHRQAAA